MDFPSSTSFGWFDVLILVEQIAATMLAIAPGKPWVRDWRVD